MCCGTPITLYETTTLTTSYTSLIPTTTTIKPYGTVETVYYTTCTEYQGTSCVRLSTYSTGVRTMDYFQTQTKTSTVTQVIPVTSMSTYPTATVSIPCHSKKGLEPLEEFGKRGEGMLSINVGSKMGIAIVALLLSSALTF